MLGKCLEGEGQRSLTMWGFNMELGTRGLSESLFALRRAYFLNLGKRLPRYLAFNLFALDL